MCRGGCDRVMYDGSNCSVVNSGPLYIGPRDKLCMLNGSSCSNINLARRQSSSSSSSSSTKCYVSTAAKQPADHRVQLTTKAAATATARRKGKSRNSSVPVHGMLQQREGKSKADRGDGDLFIDSRMSFKDRVKSKFHLKQCEGKEDSIEDPEDPYAFPDPVATDVPKTSTNSSSSSIGLLGNAAAASAGSTSSISSISSSGGSNSGSGGISASGQLSESLAPHQPLLHRARSPADAGSNVTSSGTGISIAKLYPELVEKLEGRKPQKPEQKLKSKVDSSRTMNRLQTKIAQNKIKDKLKKTQDYPVTASQCLSSASVVSQSLNLGGVVNSVVAATCGVSGQEPVSTTAFTKFPLCVVSSVATAATPTTLTTTTAAISSDGFTTSKTSAKLSSSSVAPVPAVVRSPDFNPVLKSGSLVTVPSLSLAFTTTITTTSPLHSLSSPNFGLPSLTVSSTSEPKVSHKLSSVSPSPTPPLSSSPPSVLKTQLKSPCSTASTVKTEASWQTAPIMLSNFSTSPQPTEPKFSVLHTKPNKLNILSDKEAKAKLKTDSATTFYMYHQKKKLQDHDWLGCGLNSSEEEENSEDERLPWQKDWLVLSSDEEVKDENLSPQLRSTKLAIRRTQLRRRCVQSRVAGCFNANVQVNKNKATLALIHALRDKPPAALKSLHFVLNKPHKRWDLHKMPSVRKRFCCYKNEDDRKCNKKALPCTNHCIKHIMYNVDQQLFDYCTAKFADNTQCCVPVFDIKHDLPLCQEHAAKADNYQKIQNTESKQKRPRKKPKPAALTRPPKKGKKKKKKTQRRNVRPQEPVPPAETLKNPEPATAAAALSDPAANTVTLAAMTAANAAVTNTSDVLESTSILQDSFLTAADKSVNMLPNLVPSSKRTSIQLQLPMDLAPVSSSSGVGTSTELNHIDFSKLGKNFQDLGAVLDDGFSPDSIEKSFELPLDQASKLLEEQDFQEVFNKMPDAFDIFAPARNGEYDPSKEESEDLERALAAAYKDIRDAKEKLDKLARVGDQSSQLMDVNDEEWTKHITDSLLNSVPTNPASVTATHLTPGNGLASDNLNVLDGTDLTASSLSLPGQVINASVGSISNAASNGGTTALPYNWINFNLGSVSSSLSDPSVSNCNNLLITTNNNSKQTSLLHSQSLPAELALSSSQISASVSHTLPIFTGHLLEQSNNTGNKFQTNSLGWNYALSWGSCSSASIYRIENLTIFITSSEQPEASQQVTSRAARGLPAIHTTVSPAAAVLSTHPNINSQSSPQMTTPSIQIPSSQPATLQTLLSMQNRSTSIWPSGDTNSSYNFWNFQLF
ncbi:INO80D [Acanthosepion pharaonis]|uniref:INO80D n=1 Tax=Acanthosepion pharaonis TaxID=158019 RepID=A0A812C572_ACAPH|nr:INO80D [Sepia pharaonis]